MLPPGITIIPTYSIKSYFNSNVTRISESEIEVETPEGTVSLENDYVMAMTGYHADFDFLSHIGIRLADDGYSTPACNSETFETNRSGIFLAGVVCGGMETSKLFIENSREHAVKIFDYVERGLRGLVC